MNDFTKEELIQILNCMLSSPNFVNFELLKKVKHMIGDIDWSFAPLTAGGEGGASGCVQGGALRCKHAEIVTGAYSRSDPPKKCEICGVLYK